MQTAGEYVLSGQVSVKQRDTELLGDRITVSAACFPFIFCHLKLSIMHFFLHNSFQLSAIFYCYFICGVYNVRLCFSDGEQTRLLGAEASAFTIDGLQPDEAVVIGVAAIVDQRVGEAVTLSARTNPSNGGVSGLRVTEISSQSMRVSWSRSSRATGYKIRWRRDGGNQYIYFLLFSLHYD